MAGLLGLGAYQSSSEDDDDDARTSLPYSKVSTQLHKYCALFTDCSFQHTEKEELPETLQTTDGISQPESSQSEYIII